MPMNRMADMSPASSDLGLGGALVEQVKDQTDEERKKRQRREQEMRALGPAASALGLMGMGGGLGVY